MGMILRIRIFGRLDPSTWTGDGSWRQTYCFPIIWKIPINWSPVPTLVMFDILEVLAKATASDPRRILWVLPTLILPKSHRYPRKKNLPEKQSSGETNESFAIWVG